MKITLKDGSFKEYENSKSVIEIAADISEGLARVATAGEIDGEVVDLRTVVDKDCELNILTFNDEKGKGAFRHTASHIMAQAVKRLYPETKLAIGPSVADGFYYDVDRETPFTADDLEKIEKEMKKIVKENLPIEQFTKPRNEAIEYFKEKEEPYKVELIEDLPEDETISFYSQGEFTDLCAGPHHLDFFKDLEDIRHSFHQFAALLPSDGTLIINGEIDQYQEIYAGLDCHVITYGMSPEFDYSAQNITYDEKGRVAFDFYRHGQLETHITLSVTGDHNVSNALSAIATAELLGLSMETIQKGLLSFSGTDRRFEYKGTVNGVTIVDDYAHHPTEIRATLQAAKHYPHRKLWCVFQPHTYTRTKAFFQEFAESLSHADHVILADIYAARETDTLGVSSSALADAIRSLGKDAHYFASFAEIEDFLKEQWQDGDLLITMGAGDVVKIGEDLLK